MSNDDDADDDDDDGHFKIMKLDLIFFDEIPVVDVRDIHQGQLTHTHTERMNI